MPLNSFDFPYHTVETENPESGFRAQFGGAYTFTSPPTDPDQRLFTLHFPTMKYFLDENGQLDETIRPEINMYRLIKFYQQHKLHASFLYSHPVHGMLECKFQDPLKEPEGIPGGNGAVKEFTLRFVEIP